MYWLCVARSANWDHLLRPTYWKQWMIVSGDEAYSLVFLLGEVRLSLLRKLSRAESREKAIRRPSVLPPGNRTRRDTVHCYVDVVKNV